MGKPKIKRKSTLIDMTAMSDVTVLLLTFFMLTSTFLSKEPTLVETPSSVSEEKVPMENLVTVLVSGAQETAGKADSNAEGKVFIGITGSTDSVFSNEKVRRDLLMEAQEIYNRIHPNDKVTFNKDQVAAFTKIGMFGVPMKDLPGFLNLSTQEQDAIYKYNPSDPQAYAKVGIPIDENRDADKLNEFQIWMQALQNVAQRYKNTGIETTDDKGKPTYVQSDALYDVLKKTGKGIAVKGDKNTKYEVMHVILDNLQTIKLNKFTFMTALKTEAD